MTTSLKILYTRRLNFDKGYVCEDMCSFTSLKSPTNSVDDYVRICESTTLPCLDRFAMGAGTIFGDRYMRRPNNEDIAVYYK
ncbi:hypothetical protein MTR_6g008590 [Medicago truncatula]|uniref:Uncharacterized protein n=1 Tax=Medicago truncatula TaxID=3880 RepID=G7KJF0_MEDTR|nr:hypothetical protein MTR_6g008590 [Medicago truncatula]